MARRLAVCDGLVVAELGASMPRAGGPYEYLKQIYGPKGLGRLMSFLFIWQLTFSAPLSIASGCIGLAAYAGYLWPNLRGVLLQRNLHLADSAAGAPGSECRDHAGNLAGDGHVRIRRGASLSPHHQHWAALEIAVGRRAC